jgi:hypothetical protein
VEDLGEASIRENRSEVDRRASSRIDKEERAPLVDRISVAMLRAQARWIKHRNRVELRRALLAVLAALENE